VRSLAQTHAGPAAVLIDELDTGAPKDEIECSSTWVMRATVSRLHHGHQSSESTGCRNHLVIEGNESCSDALGDRDINRIRCPQIEVEDAAGMPLQRPRLLG
jgi:hypothetical protein